MNFQLANIILSMRATTRNPWLAWHCHKAWIPDQVRDDNYVTGMTTSRSGMTADLNRAAYRPFAAILGV